MTDIIFQPIRGTQDAINNRPILEGQVLFAYDTGHIYLDRGGARYLMSSAVSGSGSSGILYADGTEEQIINIEDDNNEPTSYYLLSFDIFDANASVPAVDSLVLNSDGRFFRVTEVSVEDRVATGLLLAISGTGGGGGTGPVVEDDLFIVPNTSTIGGSFIYVYGQDYEAEVTVNSTTDDQVDLIVEFYANNNINSDPIYTISKRGEPAGEPIRINMGEVDYIGSSVAVLLKAEAANSKMTNGVTRRYNNIRFVDMRIDKHPDSNYIPIQTSTANVQLKYVPYGLGLNVTLHTLVDDVEIPNNVRLTDANMGNAQTVGIPTQPDGTHIISLYLSTVVNGAELRTDSISYQVSWALSTDTEPLIWLDNIPSTIVQYEPAVINYMVFDARNEAVEAPTIVEFYQGKTKVGSVEVRYLSTGWLKWDVTSLYSPGLNSFIIKCGNTRKSIEFEITTTGARDLSLTQPEALVFSFDSMGRSNQEVKTTRSSWISNVNNKTYTAELSNFNWYNNGWENDDDGNGSYLSVANGASVRIPFDNISLGSATQAWTFEMRFRVKNAQKYGTLVTEIPKYVYLDAQGRECAPGNEKTLDEIARIGGTPKLDEDGNYIMNEANTTEKIVETVKNIALKYLTGTDDDITNRFGFCIGTQEAYFNTSGRTVNVRYKENEIINISFVIDKANNTLSIYLNGILSGAADLNNIGYFTMENVPFLINSEYCDFNLYRFRAYNIALTMPEIIHNYLADIKNTSLYDQNQLTDVNDATKLSYTKLVEYNETHPEALTMPYAVVEMTAPTTDLDLPHFKNPNNDKKATVTFVNPVADKLLEDGTITPYDYYTHCPSYTADNVDINVQGTSSQKYPRRNFKLKFKSAKKTWIYTKGELTNTPIADGATLANGQKVSKNWHMDSEKLSTNKFTWKIDYMESSGSYNTGFANLLGSGVYSKHPLDDLQINGLDTTGFRTSVYGFPMMVFLKDQSGNYTYIGRYNMNLDKGSNEYYGFEQSQEQPYINQEWDEYEDDGETVKAHHLHPLIKDVAECWEMRDNQGTWCSFRYPTAASRAAGFGGLTSDSTQENPKLESAKHFESRYHKYADEIEAARVYNPYLDGDDFSDTIGTTNSAMCNFLRSKYVNLEALFNWLDSTDTSQIVVGQEADLPSPVELEVSQQITGDSSVTYETRIVNGTEKTFGTFTKDTIEYRRQKFRSEFNLHLDKHYCMIYFIMTELLLCYDSRGKNMMIATWGPTRNSQGNYVWYPIFYDIDTQLGLNNVGALLWDYNEDNTENRTFSTGNSVLWDNFADVFKEEIKSTYQTLRNGKINYRDIEGAYTCDPKVFTSSYAMRGIRPIVAIGLDEYYKYVLPVSEPWKSQDGSYTTANYLYACQGDRILSRELLINNRLLYMDSKWQGGDFTAEKTMSGINFRLSGNKPDMTSDKYLENTTFNMEGQEYGVYPVPYFDSVPTFTITPYLDLYLTQFVDQDGYSNTTPYKAALYTNGMETTVSDDIVASYRSGIVDEQLNYLSGSNYLSSIGDMSIRYPSEVHYTQGNRLLDITLGSDIPGYFNDKLTESSAFELGTGASENEKPLLKKIILTNLRKLNRFIDASNARKLQEFRALNTKVTYVIFANGAPLRIVHLPDTTTELHFIQNKNLTKILRSYPEVLNDNGDGTYSYKDESEYEGLYIEGVTDYQYGVDTANGSNIGIIDFEGDALGYDSYEILRNVIDQKKHTNQRLRIRMADVVWTPYTKVEIGETRQPGVTYKYRTDHNTFENYNRTTWDEDVIQEKVYAYNTDLAEKQLVLTDLSLLDFLIDDYENVTPGSINQFTNNNEAMATRASIASLSGSIHIANDSNHRISESLLTSKYGKYWDHLDITANYVNESYIAKYVDIDPITGKENDVVSPYRYDPSSYFGRYPEYPGSENNPSQIGQSFIGWGKKNNNNELELAISYDKFTRTLTPNSIFTNNVFTNYNTVITYYAMYEEQTYGLKVYSDNTLMVLDENNRQYILNAEGEREEVTILIDAGDPIPGVSVINPFKDDISLPLEQTYKFIGYSTDSTEPASLLQKSINYMNGAPNSKAVTAKDIKSNPPATINADLTVYAVFILASVYDNVLSQEHLRIRTARVKGVDQTVVYFANQNLSGKITIPKTFMDNGVEKTITWIGAPTEIDDDSAVYPLNNVTHIFFEEGNSIVGVRQRTFADWQNLIYVKFNNAMTLNRYAFARTPKLFSGLSQDHIDLFFNKLVTIGSMAFLNAGMEQSYYLISENEMSQKWIRLPNINSIDSYVFQGMFFYGISFGSPENYLTINGFTTANGVDTQITATVARFKDENGNPTRPSLQFYFDGTASTIANDTYPLYSRFNTQPPSETLIIASDGTIYDSTIGT